MFHSFLVLLQGLDIYFSFRFLKILFVASRYGKLHYSAGSLFFVDYLYVWSSGRD